MAINLKDDKLETVKANDYLALYDLGDGIACLEFRTKGGSISPELRNMFPEILDIVDAKFRGLVIANQAKNFSVGGDLNAMLDKINRKAWEELKTVKNFQDSLMAFKYFQKPIVAAPYGMTLGGGTEVCLHSHLLVAHENVKMGLVEIGVGVIPAGGGTTEMAVRAMEMAEGKGDAAKLNAVRDAVGKITTAAMAENAENARHLGFIKAADKIVTDLPGLVSEAKKACQELCENFRPLKPKIYKVLGGSAYEAIKSHLVSLREAGKISPYDEVLGGRIAFIMTGGGLPANTEVTEQHFLDLEREEYVGACQDVRTYERITNLLKHGAKLRN